MLRTVRPLIASLFFAVASLGLIAGCDDAVDTTGCSSNADCGGDRVCHQSACVAPSEVPCSTDDDCPTEAYRCLARRCIQRGTTDAGSDTGQTGDTDVDTGQTTDTSTPDTSGDVNFADTSDQTPPEVTGVVPAPGAIDVPLNQVITVEFSEPLDFVRVNDDTIELRDPSNREVPATVAYTRGDRAVTLTPTTLLQEATGYRVVVADTIRDESNNRMAQGFESRFYTVYDEPADYANLARRWAPVIYQEVAEPDGDGAFIDIPTRIDFDGNRDAADNAINAAQAQPAPAANVYYHVFETPDHTYLFYLLYYPVRDTGQARAEHDFAGAMFVIDKASDALMLVEGVKLGSTTEIPIGYKPDSSSASLRGGSVGDRSLTSFADSAMVDGTHYPMYVPSGEHAACNWATGGTGAHCQHPTEAFVGGSGVVLKPGDDAQRLDEAVDNGGQLEATYRLVPLASTFWAYRGSYGDGGLFDNPFAYDPTGTDRPEGYAASQPHQLPRTLQTDAAASFGRTPFGWLPSPGSSNDGQWLLDPAYILLNRYDLGDANAIDYCYNSFFGIDRRGDAQAGCETGTGN